MKAEKKQTAAPDFAYPQQVAKDAEKQLQAALKAGDGESVVNALIKYGIAQTSVDDANYPALVKKVTEIADSEKQPTTRSLLKMLLADIYNAYYSADRYNIDRRTTLAGESDFTLWSGEQFKEKIRSLYAEALSPREALLAAATGDYPQVINTGDFSGIFFPSLYDFASNKAITALSSLSDNQQILPINAMYLRVAIPQALSPANRQIVEIADNWVAAHSPESAPYIEALIARRDYMKRCVAPDPLNQDDNEAISAYKANRSNPYAIELLLSADVEDNGQNAAELYGIYNDFATAHPDYIRINAVKAAIARLTQPSVSVSLPSQVAKGVAAEMTFTISNAPSAKVKFYRLRSGISKTDNFKPSDFESHQFLDIEATSDKAIPFSDTIKAKFTLPEYGVYRYEIEGKKADKWHANIVRCSDIGLFSNSLADDMAVWAVDPISGKPLPGVSLKFLQSSSRKLALSAKTDKDGAAKAPDTNSGYNIFASKGADRYATPAWAYTYNQSSNTVKTAYINTDLPLYHPGDSVNIVAILYKFDSKAQSPLKQQAAKLIVRDVNNQPVDTLDVVSDQYGRVATSVKLPKEGLTGYYRIIAEDADGKHLASHRFMVSDYKLPTFDITLNDPVAEGKDFVVKGKAMGYNGFPMQNASVKVGLKGFARRFWFASAEVEFYTDTITTDQSGQFAIRITPEIAATTPFPGGMILADATVTSASGESHEASISFSVGKSYLIGGSGSELLRAVADATLPYGLYDFVNKPVDGKLQLRFTRNGKSHDISATTAGGKSTADLSGLPSGAYDLEISAPGTDADAVKFTDVSVYNAADTNSPSDDALWLLNNRISLTQASKRTAEIIYAVNRADSYVLLTVNSPDKVLSRKWLRPDKGINKLKVEVPEGVDRVTVTLTTVNDFTTDIRTVNIYAYNPAAKLNVKIERLRDRVTPNAEETITVKITDGSGAGKQSALILDMYSKALNALESHSWAFAAQRGYLPSLSTNSFNPGTSSEWFNGKTARFDVSPIFTPSFNLYGLGFGAPHQLMIRGTMMRKYNSAAPTAAAGNADFKEALEGAVMGMEVVSESKMEASADLAESDDSGADSGGAAEEKNLEEQYRPSEIALALFAPNLTTDPQGNLTYSFTVPNANTTWALYALAYDEAMTSDLATAEIISSKPIMIEPNLPRFIRQGDTADILALVMNSTDEQQTVDVTYECISPVNMTGVASITKAVTLAPHSSETVKFSLHANALSSAAIVRLKASGANYTDGVQTLIPVLPATQQVIDAETFYLTPDQKELSMPIGNNKDKDATTIVSFCENPTWEVVSALPGLRADESTTSLAASAAIFSAAVSEKVMNLNPAVEQGLKQWLDGAKGDGALLAMLNRNEDLKQLALASTPWVQNAESDAERLTRLALLFDRKEIASAIDNGADQLAKLQCGDGGWCWTDHYKESSLWVTLGILNNFAELRQLNCYPAKLDPMVKKALKYVDSEVAKSYAEYPSGDYLYYTYVRGLYPEVAMSVGATKAFNATIKSVASGWKRYSVGQKAAAALMLYRSGRKAEAANVLNSIREFATYTPQSGMSWPSVRTSSFFGLSESGQTAFILEAFNTIEPGCKDIDRIRQWLILNKVVQDWGTSVNASACVASILQCGSNWLYKPGSVEIAVGGKPLKPSEVDSLTGAFHTAVANPKGNLTITRANDGPAWGAVMTRSTRVMTDVKAHSLPELSIEKQMLVNNDGQWVNASDMAVGQTVKVRLIINSARDMDYVTIVDNRSATMEPVVQTPRPVYCDGICFYLENRDAATNLFISHLPKGQYIIEYETFVNNAGSYSSGVATIQSQYTPEMTAHSAGTLLRVAR